MRQPATRPGWVTRLTVLSAGLVVLVALAGPRRGELTAQADLVVTPLIHASIQIEHGERVIQVDPWSAANLDEAKPADLILVTDDPGHHLDPDAIERLRKPGAPVVLTAGGHAAFPEGQVLANGEAGVFAGIPVEAVPAYDLTPGEPLHPKGEANGYVITLGPHRIYVAGVTECVPEIQALERIDLAFLPMNLPVDRMRPIPAAECAKTFQPGVVYVYHYDQAYARWLAEPVGPRPDTMDAMSHTLRVFRDAIDGEPIEFRPAPWYPPASSRP